MINNGSSNGSRQQDRHIRSDWPRQRNTSVAHTAPLTDNEEEATHVQKDDGLELMAAHSGPTFSTGRTELRVALSVVQAPTGCTTHPIRSLSGAPIADGPEDA